MSRPALRRLPIASVTAAVVAAALIASTGAVAAPGNGKGKPGPTEPPAPAGPDPALACHVLPDAAALSTQTGRTIDVLHPYRGRVYYGYGDYSANTGSMSQPHGTNVSSFDPATGATTVHLAGFKTEEVDTYRTIDGHLYVPNIDPSAGADADNSYASDAGEAGTAPGTWAENPGAPGTVHVYDVAKLGDDLFIAGSTEWSGATDGAAVVWRSTDGGATWQESLVETEDDPALRNGFERYYWLGVVDGRLYTRAALNLSWPDLAALRVFDPATGAWSVVPESVANGFGSGVYDGHDVVSWDGRLWASTGTLTWFDGRATGRIVTHAATSRKDPVVHLASGTQSVGDDGRLYAKDLDGVVHRIDRAPDPGPTKGRNGGGQVADPYVATRVATIPADASAITVAAGRLWASGSWGDAKVCSYVLQP
jgi:hypothetical protein